MTYMSEPEIGMQKKKALPAKPMSKTAQQILHGLVQEWIDFFLEKNAGYGDMSRDLGARAQFVDINRKVGKLRRALWDNQSIGDEDVREVTLDLIGHCFLLIDLLDNPEV